MPDFRSLAELLQGPPDVPACVQSLPASGEPCANAQGVSAALNEDRLHEDRSREVRLFSAHLREAMDRALASLLADIAREVLGRELALAPADIAALVDVTLQRHLQAQPLRVRVHRDDLHSFSNCEIPVVVDNALTRGDAMIELRNGTVDLALAARIEDVATRPRAA